LQACVYLVGAGPGDADLISVRGLECIRRADCIVYDSLIDRRLLDEALPNANLIFVGKRAGNAAMKQENICELLVELSGKYEVVVRLKGGDPFLFGRGGEEALALKKKNVRFEVVPGVTAALAAGALAGIPLTHRKVSSSVTLVTGHRAPDADEPVDWPKIASSAETIAVYMGVGSLEKIIAGLKEGGRSEDEGAAFVENAAKPDQRVIIGALSTIAQKVRDAGGEPPAILIVGKVVGLADNLAWFESGPLAKKKFLLLRPAGQSESAAALLSSMGATVVRRPIIEIKSLEDTTGFDRLVKGISDYDWLVFTSVNGVRSFFERLDTLGRDTRHLSGVRVASVGPATTKALKGRGVNADCQAEIFTTAGLAKALIGGYEIAGCKIALARSAIAPPELAEVLRDEGADVDEVSAYEVETLALGQETRSMVLAGEFDGVLFTSPSTVKGFLESFGSSERRVLRDAAGFFSIGPVTTRAIHDAGFDVACEASPHTIEGIAEALAKYYSVSSD